MTRMDLFYSKFSFGK